eukprot:TRINITY_DN9449_c0_g1_i2.p1 TRINITY_DN9449_c0_g1~~TRINITY_DN9449_c0_g1_i2.p1  ORF type:complete len:380 (-),score=50.20 TRINITY_DN9449_c0_g1_i2:250-1359(-)
MGVDASVRNNYCLRRAAAHGYVEVVQRLIQQTNVEQGAVTAVLCGIAGGHTPVVEFFLSLPMIQASLNYTQALQQAISSGRVEIVDLLLQQIPKVPRSRTMLDLYDASVSMLVTWFRRALHRFLTYPGICFRLSWFGEPQCHLAYPALRTYELAGAQRVSYGLYRYGLGPAMGTTGVVTERHEQNQEERVKCETACVSMQRRCQASQQSSAKSCQTSEETNEEGGNKCEERNEEGGNKCDETSEHKAKGDVAMCLTNGTKGQREASDSGGTATSQCLGMAHHIEVWEVGVGVGGLPQDLVDLLAAFVWPAPQRQSEMALARLFRQALHGLRWVSQGVRVDWQPTSWADQTHNVVPYIPKRFDYGFRLQL